MAKYRTTICPRECEHSTIGEAYECARRRLDDQAKLEMHKPTQASGSGTPLFSVKRCEGLDLKDLDEAELEELDRIRKNWEERGGP